MPAVQEQSPAIRIRNLSKGFGATQALSGVSLELSAGKIHALIGLNGSGKSTLVKILSGFHRADDGEISMGEVAFVHQDLGLLPSMTVLENFAIGRTMATRHGQIDWRSEEVRTTEALREFGLHRLVRRQVASLTQAEQTIVAIARALDRSSSGQASALVLDEPTSALPNREIGLLASSMRAYAARGIAILFITHRLQEVKDIADEVTVLRNGRTVFTGSTTELTIVEMVEKMVGDAVAKVSEEAPRSRSRATSPVLSARSVRSSTVKDISFDVRGGEIVGMFGMSGGGIESIGGLLSGRAAPRAGSVHFCGVPLAVHSKRVREIGYVPSERPRKGVFPGLSVRDNITLRSLPMTLRRGRISRREEHRVAMQFIEGLKIKPKDPSASISTLSGGNQQKAVLGRWLAIKPKAIVAEEPTQGIDVWAKMEILRQLRAAAESGAAVLLTAVEPEGILEFCDRVIVLREGSISLDAPRLDLSTTDILSAMH